ncbi:phosphatidylinositol 4,5-bisphosphate 5-phosphatase A isoform X2 [Culicoides brevitarsis]|uniref:phosphatidylinositol 4,5-bisphosphate 5-phosphatase A isoform X2 n=1 Tax=Culicoides brevitarsis TaxID=469753 RepID=UPI00307C845D
MSRNSWNIELLLFCVVILCTTKSCVSNEFHDLRVYIVTWNVGTKQPDNLHLHDLLGLESKPENDKNQPDFYVIGLQEVSAQPQNKFVNLFKVDPWIKQFKNILKKRDYIIVKSEHLQGLLLVVFAKRKHVLHLREVETEYTRTGLAGFWGNKGAVSIRFNAYGSTVCVVNAHLAAHDNKLDERIEDYNSIVKDMKFNVGISRDIFSHDYVFWFGDLNFRIREDFLPNPQDVKARIMKDDLEELMRNDQLLQVRNEGRAFQQLEEKLPMFPPTFKFEEGTNNYDLKRRPAWCDRVLYKVTHENVTNIKLDAKQTSYRSHPNYTISDHKPVTSEFSIKVIDDPTELVAEFEPINLWTVGEENTITYILPPGFEEKEADWIGVFKEHFTSLDKYQAWEYTNRDENDRHRQRSQRRELKLTFPDSVSLREGRKYRLLYFQSTGTRGVTGLAGIGDPFPIQKRARSPGPDDVD